MKGKYNNLRSKTIFDFTRDESILKEVLSEGTFLDYEENPKEFVENCFEWLEPMSIVGYMVDYSKNYQNNGLYTALKKEFRDDYPSMFNTRKGVLVN